MWLFLPIAPQNRPRYELSYRGYLQQPVEFKTVHVEKQLRTKPPVELARCQLGRHGWHRRLSWRQPPVPSEKTKSVYDNTLFSTCVSEERAQYTTCIMYPDCVLLCYVMFDVLLAFFTITCLIIFAHWWINHEFPWHRGDGLPIILSLPWDSQFPGRRPLYGKDHSGNYI